MSSSYKSLHLFDSGPHRFHVRPIGEYVLVNSLVNPFSAGSQPIGPLDLAVVITGRLIAAGDAALWAIRDAIAAQLTHPPQVGALVDHHGRTWNDMSFVEFRCTPSGTPPVPRTDRARVVSIAYSAVLVRFATTT